VLEEDFARLPAILGHPAAEAAPVVPLVVPGAPQPAVQLGLF
jgi:hypothetical protein